MTTRVVRSCDQCGKNIGEDDDIICRNCTLSSDNIRLAEYFAKRRLPSDPLERVIAQRNRLFHVLIDVAIKTNNENDSPNLADRLYTAARDIVATAYEEGADIYESDVNQESTWPNTEKYKKVAAMIIKEREAFRSRMRKCTTHG